MAAGRGDVDPKSLNVQGGTQPDYYPDTVNDMVAEIRADPDDFWSRTLQADGPIEIWVIGGGRFLANGNHRYRAAEAAGADIPDHLIVVKDMTGSQALTFRFDEMTPLPGRK